VSAETQRTRTREVVEAQTVEEEEHYCPHCEQWFDEHQLVPVGIAVDGDGEDPEEVDQLCETCAENIFGYDGPTGVLQAVRDEVQRWTWKEMISSGVSTAIPLGVAAICLKTLSSVLAEMSVPKAASTFKVASETVTSVMGLIPVVVALALLISIASTIGPRRI